MKKLLVLFVSFCVCSVFAELPIPQTSFRKASLETVAKAVLAGHPDAQMELALRAYAGHQVDKDDAKAFELMALSAGQGYSKAFFLMSRMYAEGIGTEPDVGQEALWFAKAIVASPKSKALQDQYALYLEDAARAPAVLRASAELGYRPAEWQLMSVSAIEMYQNGQYEDALLQFLSLADNGSPECAWYVGRIYADGLSSLAKDDVEALSWFQQAAEGGYVSAQYELAMRYVTGVGIEADLDEAARWYGKAAEGGHAGAQFQLGELAFRRAEAAEHAAALEGRDAPGLTAYRKALKEAVRWYVAAAEQDDADALFVMGRLFASGEGVPRSPMKAMDFYERAAAQGHAEAGFYLGLMLHAGLGGSKDLPRAVELYQAAAEQGVTGALYYLANCYRFGEGVPKHPVKGEGLYYGKLLKNVERLAGGGEDAPDEWTLAAAREYGLILWNRADTMERRVDASSWVGLAAQNGDEAAQGIFRRMNELGDRENTRGVLAEHPVDPAEDAVKKRRRGAFFPYVQQDLKTLFRKSDARQKIVGVDKGFGGSRNVMGDSLDGVTVVYDRPEASRSVGFRGIVLTGLEFTDDATGERYWSMAPYLDDSARFSIESTCNLFVSVDMAFCPDAKLTGWAVVYGHLLSDGRTIAVFDTEEEGGDSFADLFARNRYSKVLENNTSVSVDMDQVILSVLEEDVASEGGLMDSLLDRLVDLIDITD